jgi:hypothetical protein
MICAIEGGDVAGTSEKWRRFLTDIHDGTHPSPMRDTKTPHDPLLNRILTELPRDNYRRRAAVRHPVTRLVGVSDEKADH